MAVDFPKYYQNFVCSMGVPAFAISRDGLIANWNTSMEGLTHVRGEAGDEGCSSYNEKPCRMKI